MQLRDMSKRLIESNMQKIELEQDLAIMKKKFKVLLTQKQGGGEETDVAAAMVKAKEADDKSNLLL